MPLVEQLARERVAVGVALGVEARAGPTSSGHDCEAIVIGAGVAGIYQKMYAIMLMRKARSWFTGYNSNVEGHEAGTIRYFVYNAGAPKYRARLREVVESGYDGLVFSLDTEATSERPAPATSAAGS